MTQAKGWCYTLNNWTEEEYDVFYRLECNYHVIGEETGENGTDHLQGYIEFKTKKRMTQLKKINQRAHWEIRRGTPLQASEYCKKEEQWWETGEMSIQGQRNDLCEIRKTALEEGMLGVTAKAKNAQQMVVAEKFLTYHEEPRDWETEVIWLHGPSGAGKSRLAREICPNAYTKSEGSKWWNGYDGHEEVIIDDFRDSWWCLTETLRLLDRYECRVETKGGMRQFKPLKIVVTSIFAPTDCYRGVGEDIVQLTRRIKKCSEVKCSEVGEVILELPSWTVADCFSDEDNIEDDLLM